MCADGSNQPYRVIAAVDGSEHSRAALGLLHDLPLPEGSQITLLAVILPRNASDYALLEGVLTHAREFLESPGLEVQAELLTGYPGEQLQTYGEISRPDLMILGAKGLRSTFGILLGGVAQQMVEYASWPVMIARAPYRKLGRVLLTVDGSDYSRSALQYLTWMPLPVGVDVHLIHVLPPARGPQATYQYFPHGAELYLPPLLETDEDTAAFKELLKEEERQGETLLDEFSRVLREHGFAPDCVMQRGDAASEILDYADRHEVDLIITGARGLSSVKDLLLGSVPRKLAHYGKSSILIVKGGRYGKG
jgi:nucleotide-binding universal stress UspA family protein